MLSLLAWRAVLDPEGCTADEWTAALEAQLVFDDSGKPRRTWAGEMRHAGLVLIVSRLDPQWVDYVGTESWAPADGVEDEIADELESRGLAARDNHDFTVPTDLGRAAELLLTQRKAAAHG